MTLPIVLPKHILALIKEYSYSITKPDWKKGAPHAKALQNSEHFINIQDMIINIKDYYNYNYNKIFDTLFNYTLLKLPFNVLLQNYGDEVFNLFQSYKPGQLNFYRLCRLMGHLRIVKFKIIDIPTKMEFK